MKNKIFIHIDRLLPRSVAILPYLFALIIIRLLLKAAIGQNTKVWCRNSIKTGTFTFGLSDLDLTVIAGSHFNRNLFNNLLSVSKKIFIFLGETNLYHEEDVPKILTKTNIFELKRDPVLCKHYLPPAFNQTHEENDKFVFLQRMLFTTFHALQSEPTLQQKKWRGYMEIAGVDHADHFIDVLFVFSQLLNIVDGHKEIKASLHKWSKLAHSGETDFYRKDLGIGFRIIAPHLQMWEPDQFSTFFSNLNAKEKMIIKRQIDWEIWGIYTQSYWLNKEQSETHIQNLSKIYESLK